ncbi:hypothetical protein H1164_08360 [Thermoactinomyces daqus]|uniref:DUF7680 domain-containing protein n=1 Tax=Thermoactinomyces daqus TaxID=1329516 RepID=A0A7W1XA29_9BACL|nr:hypothetical protein [Thermoactinomyces daqus]MBA4542913.1 hypothetical protein [Thermoactinomyces daqus]
MLLTVSKSTKNGLTLTLTEKRNNQTNKCSIYGTNLSACLPVIKRIISYETDDYGAPAELQSKIVPGQKMNITEKSFYHLALIMKLQQRLQDRKRAELIALRVERFSKEEATYWWSRIVDLPGYPARWAIEGLRTILCGSGKPGDDELVIRMIGKIKRN